MAWNTAVARIPLPVISTQRTQISPERAMPPQMQITTQGLGIGSASFNPTVEQTELHTKYKTRNT